MSCRPRGLALLELLLASSLLSLLFAVLLALFSQSRGAGELGVARLSLRAQHRESHKRLAPLLRSAIPPDEVQPAIGWPTLGQSDSLVKFHAPENLLDRGIPFDPRLPEYPEYTAKLAGDLLQAQLSDGSGSSRRLGTGFTQVVFRRIGTRALEIELRSQSELRGLTRQLRSIEEVSRSVVFLPSVRSTP